MVLAFILFGILCIYLLLEKWYNDRCLASFHAVIHVNGIRGKTSTCRLLDASLRTRYRVFTKTTGTDPVILNTKGEQIHLRRLGPANIHEQLRTIRRAYREGAEILILECMAVRPELQKISQRSIVKSSITIITNVRYDHIYEMGMTLEEIAASLGETVPNNGILYTAAWDFAEYYREICCRHNSRLVLADHNTALAAAVSEDLGITQEAFAGSRSQMIRDFGTCDLYPLQNSQKEPIFFLNLFSVNDPQSTKLNLENAAVDFTNIYFIYNHRLDRPDRALLFARYFFPHYPGAAVYLTGDSPRLVKRIFEKEHPELTIRIADPLQAVRGLPAGSLLVGIGNIKGKAYELIEKLEEGRHSHE